MKTFKEILTESLKQEVVYQGSNKKYQGKIATLLNKEPSGNYTIKFSDGIKITEVPSKDVRFVGKGK